MRLLRNVVSVVLAVLGWIGFGFLWWWAFTHASSSTRELRDIIIIALVSLIIVIVTWAWVQYNVWLYRHHKWTGPMHRRPEPYDYAIDTLNRQVAADFNSILKARYVVIDIIDNEGREVKVYSPGSEELTEEEVGMCDLL